jgi:hypothetical protein
VTGFLVQDDSMPHVYTRFAIFGFKQAEAVAGIPHLVEEFRQRPWLSKTSAWWDSQRGCLVVAVEREGSNPAINGGEGGANLDEVSDCVIACIQFSSDGIRFSVEESSVVPDAAAQCDHYTDAEDAAAAEWLKKNTPSHEEMRKWPAQAEIPPELRNDIQEERPW